MIHRAGHSNFLTSFDLTRAYHQLRLETGSQPKTAFSILGKTYCYKRLPFRLSTAPQIFQSVVNGLLGEKMPETTSCYLDDILIHSKGSFWAHLERVREGLQIIREANLRQIRTPQLDTSDEKRKKRIKRPSWQDVILLCLAILARTCFLKS